MNKLIFICCLFLTGHVFSQSVATVLFTSHTVKVKRGGVESNISRGASLQNGDTIVTSGQAVAKIKYANGTLVTLGENSVYKILAYSGNQHDIQIKSELTSGKIHSKTSGKKKEILKTPVVALAILGTNVYTRKTLKPRTCWSTRERFRQMAKRWILAPDFLLPQRVSVKHRSHSRGELMTHREQELT
ncbi:FecR domain-containing protein [Legionella spiritensis]|uniref:FecR domain-containing protein n=1 Tax=Legionella spiritensis TaxID=452 RepID=UPI000F6F0A8E|nr:FecR domain-containing protein [Legionella spiritensis]VEG92601.1 FecR protein [Legionella spiritensis]